MIALQNFSTGHPGKFKNLPVHSTTSIKQKERVMVLVEAGNAGEVDPKKLRLQKVWMSSDHMHACMFGVSGGGGGVGRTLGVQSQMLFLRDLCDVQLREQEREFAARVRSRYKQQKKKEQEQERQKQEVCLRICQTKKESVFVRVCLCVCELVFVYVCAFVCLCVCVFAGGRTTTTGMTTTKSAAVLLLTSLFNFLLGLNDVCLAA